MKCDLCSTRTSLHASLLCEDCQDVITRLMTIKEWESNRGQDVMRNEQQKVMLQSYLTVREKAKGTTC